MAFWKWLLASESRIYGFMTKSSYLPSTLSEHKYVEASGYTCCYQALCPNRYIQHCIIAITGDYNFGQTD